MVTILQRRKNSLETAAQGASSSWRKTINFPGCRTQGPKACTRAQPARACLRVVELWPFPCHGTPSVSPRLSITWLLPLVLHGQTFCAVGTMWSFSLLIHGLTFCAIGISCSLVLLLHGLTCASGIMWSLSLLLCCLTFCTAGITWTSYLLPHGLTFCTAGITWSLSLHLHGLNFCAAGINQHYVLYKIGGCINRVINICKSVLSVCPIGVDLWVFLHNSHPTNFLMVT